MEKIENTGVAGEETTQPMETDVTPAREERTFTQDDVNRIVQERLARRDGKDTALTERIRDLEEREKAFAQREFEQSAREILKEHKLSDKLLTVLNVSDLDGLKDALDILDELFDYRDDGPRLYTTNPDGTMTRHKRGDPVPKFTTAISSDSSIPLGTDSIRKGMGLKRKG